MKLQLSVAMDRNPRTQPILDGTVSPDGIDWIPTEVFPSGGSSSSAISTYRKCPFRR